MSFLMEGTDEGRRAKPAGIQVPMTISSPAGEPEFNLAASGREHRIEPVLHSGTPGNPKGVL